MEKKDEFISSSEAIKLYQDNGLGKISWFAIRDWTIRYSLGKKLAGRWKINKQKFLNFINANPENLI